MNENDLRDLLPTERRLPADRRREMKERLVLTIEKEEQAARSRYRLVVAGVAAAALVVVGAVAVFAGLSGDDTSTGPSDHGMTTVPDPEQDPEQPPVGPDEPSGLAPRQSPVPSEVAQATANVSGARQDPDEEWRSRLAAEWVSCVAPEEGVPVNAETMGNTQVDFGLLAGGTELASSFGETLTEASYLQWCASRNWADDSVQTDAYAVEQATACVRDSGYPLAAVALAGLSCEDIAEPGVVVREMNEGDLALLNRMRAVEVALAANPNPCPTQAEATEWAEEINTEEDLGLEVSPIAGDGIPEDSDCFQPFVMSWWPTDEDSNLYAHVGMITPPDGE